MSTQEVMALVQRAEPQIQAALPAGVNLDRIVRMTRTALSTNAQLQKCGPRSVLGAVIECAQLGLEPGITGHLVPFWDSKTKGYRAQLIADYRGLIALAIRSGHVTAVWGEVVREGDFFEYEVGDAPRLSHRPVLDSAEDVVAAYACARLRDGSITFKVIGRAKLDKVRDAVLGKMKEAARKYAPWTQHEEEMQIKTAIRRLCKMLPFSTEDSDLQRAIILDEAADRGEQHTGAVLDGVADVVEDESAEPLSEEAREALSAEIGQKAGDWVEDYEKAQGAS